MKKIRTGWILPIIGAEDLASNGGWYQCPAILLRFFRPVANDLRSCPASSRIDGLLFGSPAMSDKANLAVFESALAVLGSSLAVNGPANNLYESLP